MRYFRGEYMSGVGGESGFQEHVALGFRLSDVEEAGVVDAGAAWGRDDETLSAALGMTVEGDLVWIDLHNSAVNSRTDFTVQGEEVRKAIEDTGCMPIVLWHSHYAKSGPSTEDMDNFPSWLVGEGLVYTVKNGATVAYGNSVRISDASAEEQEGSRRWVK